MTIRPSCPGSLQMNRDPVVTAGTEEKTYQYFIGGSILRRVTFTHLDTNHLVSTGSEGKSWVAFSREEAFLEAHKTNYIELSDLPSLAAQLGMVQSEPVC